MTDYVDLVGYIVKSIADHPDAVSVTGHGGRRSETIEIRVHAEDVGRVIGKSGRIIEAIRAVVKAAAIKDHVRIGVEVITEDEPPLQGQAGTLAAEPEPALSEGPANAEE